jgi:hypothetical protein
MKVIDVQVQTFTREAMKYQPNLKDIERMMYSSGNRPLCPKRNSSPD